MSAHSTPRRAAIALGTASSCGAGYLLLKDDVVAGQWSDSFVLVPLLLGIAVVAGHLAARALNDRSTLAALGFAGAFILGTALTVYTSVSKQATTTDAKALETVASNQDRSVVEAQLRIAMQRYEQALDQAAQARSSGGCGRVCSDWSQRAGEVDTRVRELQARLKSMDPARPVAAGAERMAQVVSVLTGSNAAQVKAWIVLFEPFAFPLTFEFTAIVAFGYGFGGTRPTQTASQEVETQPTATEEPPSSRRDPLVEQWVTDYNRRHGRDPQLTEVQARFPKLGRTTCYRYAKRKHGAA